MATQGEPLNRIALQDLAATLMRQTGEPTHSLLASVDTRAGELRIDNALAGKRVLVAAPKLPTALDALFKGINTRISQLKTPQQVYDLSFEAHFQLLTLNPFGAGNGPMARFLMSYIQHYYHLPLSGVMSTIECPTSPHWKPVGARKGQYPSYFFCTASYFNC